MNASNHILRVVSLRSESSNDESFETILKNAGHKVTVLSSTEPAFALLNSSWPDVVLFDPISQFGMSGSVQRIRSTFDGVIVATGHIPDPTISAMLEELGISRFAATASELLSILKNVPNRVVYNDDDSIGLVANEPVTGSTDPSDRRLTDADRKTLAMNQILGGPEPEEDSPISKAVEVDAEDPSTIDVLPNQGKSKSTLKRWHRMAIGVAVTAAVIIGVSVPFVGVVRQPVEQPRETVATTPDIVPNLMIQPLAPLTLEELSGETLPLEIAGIQDRAVLEQNKVAFWGDTAPDAFVTVNGDPVEVSEYGAFIVDFALEDGANFIEVLASDFQGRTTRQSFVVVSLQ